MSSTGSREKMTNKEEIGSIGDAIAFQRQRAFKALDQMEPRLRELINKINMTSEQTIEIYQVYKEVGLDRTIKWIENQADEQLPGWRQWK
jgi:hypothetical protein